MALAAAYLAGTYLQNLPLFGAVARPSVGPDDGAFSLTFDDGPDPRHTPAISRLLAERGHHGTFFVLGRAARAHQDLIRQLAADGHEIACHGDDHRLLAFAGPGTVASQLSAWEEAVEAALGCPGARLLRTPHGVRSPWLGSVARRRGFAVCGWDGRVFDTAEPGAATIARRVIGLLRPGAVVLLHDGDGSGRFGSRAQTVAAAGRGARRRRRERASLGDPRIAARSTGADVSHDRHPGGSPGGECRSRVGRGPCIAQDRSGSVPAARETVWTCPDFLPLTALGLRRVSSTDRCPRGLPPGARGSAAVGDGVVASRVQSSSPPRWRQASEHGAFRHPRGTVVASHPARPASRREQRARGRPSAPRVRPPPVLSSPPPCSCRAPCRTPQPRPPAPASSSCWVG